MKQLPRAWMGVLYGAVVWLPVLASLYQNNRAGVVGRWSVFDWITMFLFWAVGSFLWMVLCDRAINRIGTWRGWWSKSTR